MAQLEAQRTILFDEQPANQATAFEIISNGFMKNNVPPVVANNCTRTWTKIAQCWSAQWKKEQPDRRFSSGCSFLGVYRS
jgi:hypothetical protein